MATRLKEIEDQALKLSPRERGKLTHRLIVSLEGAPQDTPEAIAKAWDEEIARRVADMESAARNGSRRNRYSKNRRNNRNGAQAVRVSFNPLAHAEVVEAVRWYVNEASVFWLTNSGNKSSAAYDWPSSPPCWLRLRLTIRVDCRFIGSPMR
jgi:hypothetical protein